MKKATKETKTIGLRADQSLRAFIDTLGDTTGSGAEFGLSALQAMVEGELRDLVGAFSQGELSAMIDVSNSLLLTPRFLGFHLAADLADASCLEGIDEKWNYDPKALDKKLSQTPRAARMALEIWAKAFWRGEAHDKPGALEEYVKRLV